MQKQEKERGEVGKKGWVFQESPIRFDQRRHFEGERGRERGGISVTKHLSEFWSGQENIHSFLHLTLPSLRLSFFFHLPKRKKIPEKWEDNPKNKEKQKVKKERKNKEQRKDKEENSEMRIRKNRKREEEEGERENGKGVNKGERASQ